MTKADIVEVISERNGFSTREVKIVLEHFGHLYAVRSLIIILPFIREKSDLVFLAFIPQSAQYIGILNTSFFRIYLHLWH